MSKAKGQALGNIFAAAAEAGPAASGRALPRPLPPAVSAFLGVVDRLEAVLDAETDALTRNIPADVRDLGNRKRQGLLEMTRALRATGPRAEVRERLGRFSVAVERNRAALGTQLHAVREIADIIADSMKEAESDGTYSLRVGRS